MAKVIIPTPLRKFTGNEANIHADGQTVKDVIEDVSHQYPQIKNHLIDEHGQIRSFIRIFVGDEDTLALQGDQTGVQTDSVVSIVPAIAGGSTVIGKSSNL